MRDNSRRKFTVAVGGAFAAGLLQAQVAWPRENMFPSMVGR